MEMTTGGLAEGIPKRLLAAGKIAIIICSSIAVPRRKLDCEQKDHTPAVVGNHHPSNRHVSDEDAITAARRLLLAPPTCTRYVDKVSEALRRFRYVDSGDAWSTGTTAS